MGAIFWIIIVGLPLLFAINFVHIFFAKYIYRIDKNYIKEIGFLGMIGISVSTFFTGFASAIILVKINPDLNTYLKEIFGVNMYIVLGYFISIFIYSGLIKLTFLLRK